MHPDQGAHPGVFSLSDTRRVSLSISRSLPLSLASPAASLSMPPPPHSPAARVLQVWKEATEEGNVWKVAALNRYQDGKQQRAPQRLALTLDASGGSIVSGDGGGGGMQLAERQAANLDPGPMQFEEASSSYEREEEEKAKSSAAREAEQSRQRKAERKNKIRKLREAARQREEGERAMVRQERELA